MHDIEQEFLEKLKQTYKQASLECEQAIRDLNARKDLQNIQSIIYRRKYQEAIKQQISLHLKALKQAEGKDLIDFLTSQYHLSTAKVLFEMNKQGIPILLPFNPDSVIRASYLDSKINKHLYKAMGENYERLKEQIARQISVGIASGKNYHQIAQAIASGMNSPFKTAYSRSKTIVRTEAHRISQQAFMDTCRKATRAGAMVVKQWNASGDERVRDEHALLDGVIKPIDEPFIIGGLKALYPSGFNDPAQDINCRCSLSQRAVWALSDRELQQAQNAFNDVYRGSTNSLNAFSKRYLEQRKQQ